MENKTADLSVEAMAPGLHRAEDPLEALHPPPAASTAGMSATETLPSEESLEPAPTIDRRIGEGPMMNLASWPAAEAPEIRHGQEVASPEASRAQDCTMAMENNPVTTAGTDVLETYDNATDQETLKPPKKPESSATGWTVATPAATPSKISFDGS